MEYESKTADEGLWILSRDLESQPETPSKSKPPESKIFRVVGRQWWSWKEGAVEEKEEARVN